MLTVHVVACGEQAVDVNIVPTRLGSLAYHRVRTSVAGMSEGKHEKCATAQVVLLTFMTSDGLPAVLNRLTADQLQGNM